MFLLLNGDLREEGRKAGGKNALYFLVAVCLFGNGKGSDLIEIEHAMYNGLTKVPLPLLQGAGSQKVTA